MLCKNWVIASCAAADSHCACLSASAASSSLAKALPRAALRWACAMSSVLIIHFYIPFDVVSNVFEGVDMLTKNKLSFIINLKLVIHAHQITVSATVCVGRKLRIVSKIDCVLP